MKAFSLREEVGLAVDEHGNSELVDFDNEKVFFIRPYNVPVKGHARGTSPILVLNKKPGNPNT